MFGRGAKMVALALERSDKSPAFVNINDLVPNVTVTLEITDNSLLLVQSSIDDPMIGGQSSDEALLPNKTNSSGTVTIEAAQSVENCFSYYKKSHDPSPVNYINLTTFKPLTSTLPKSDECNNHEADSEERNVEDNTDDTDFDRDDFVSENYLENLQNEDLGRQELSLENHEQSSNEKDLEDNENDPDYEEEDDLVSDDEFENLHIEENQNRQSFLNGNSGHKNTPGNEQTLDVQSQNITNKKRRKKAAPEMWDKNQNKQKRMKGEEYIGYTRSKDGIVQHKTVRGKKVMGSKCDSNFCKKASNRFCHLFAEEIRQSVFDKFWDMNWDQKRLFIANMVSYTKKKRSYVNNPSRRKGSYEYFLKLEDGKKYQVCRNTFLRTLGLKEKMVSHWVNEGQAYGIMPERVQTPKNRESESFQNMKKRQDHLKHFFEQIPKMESHYCRQRTSKLYFEHDFKSKSEVNNVYKQKCEGDNIMPLSIFCFIKEMDILKIALFKPRKDQCDVCIGYKTRQVEELEYQKHLKAKDDARNEKQADKKKAQNNLIHCFTMDVQAVKLCPKMEVSKAYYKTKRQVHNFTMYNLATHESKNFLWNESEGKLCSSIFTTCIIKHLTDVLTKEQKPVVLYSDSCGYQNKNNILSNALSVLTSKFNTEIEQKFLEKGHTQMECDSTHSLIERRSKGREIYLPTDYIGIIKDARKKPKPLDVEYLNHSFFLDYEDRIHHRYTSIRPGNKKDDLKVSDVKCIKYVPDGNIFYKSSYTDSYLPLPQRQKPIDADATLKPLYKERLRIKKLKWTHLQELKKVLPIDTHFFYDTLQFKETNEQNLDELQTDELKSKSTPKSKTKRINNKETLDALRKNKESTNKTNPKSRTKEIQNKERKK